MTIETFPGNPRTLTGQPPLPPEAQGPGSFSVTTQLMQDAIQAGGVSVGDGAWNQEALFANPFKDGREEALIIDDQGHLTYLERREESDTGWVQEIVRGVSGMTFAEVVVAVHPNGGVYAFAAPAGDSDTSLVQVLLLGKSAEANGVAQCSWAVQQDAVNLNFANRTFAMQARNFRSACVSYSPDGGPTIAAGPGAAGGPYSLISAGVPGREHAKPWIWDAGTVPVGAKQRLVGAGYLPYSAVNGKPRGYVLYFLTGQTLTRLTQIGFNPTGDKSASQVSTTQLSTTVAQFCGTMNIPNFPRREEYPASDVAAVYLDMNGDLVVSYLNSVAGWPATFESRTSGLGFVSAKCWQDADGKAHVFGVDGKAHVFGVDGPGTLRVLHQSSWRGTESATEPAWTQAAVVGAPDGIGGYDLKRPADRLVAFDYASSGCSDHLLAYRPGAGTVWVLERTASASVFDRVFDSAAGLPGYDFAQDADTVVAFDYTGSGSADHLIAYRPGAGKLSVFARQSGGPGFTAVVAVPSGGIGECLNHTADRLVPFDFTGSGHADHLLCYRPGTGKSWVLAVGAGGSLAVVAAFTGGLGGFALDKTVDQVTGFDYEGTGSADHLLAYRPGSGMVFILARDGTRCFTAVVRSSDGIGGYDLRREIDRLLPFDYYGRGKADHLLAYRPAAGTVFVLERVGTTTAYNAIVTRPDGLGGYDFSSAADTVTGYDYSGTGSPGYLVAYRPGAGKVSVMGRPADMIVPVYQAPPGPSVNVTVGLQTRVADFQLDPYPDYEPSELIKMSGMTAAEAYCICTQDVTTAGWQQDKVRLPTDPAADPHIVSRYVANAALLSRQGAPMPGHNVSISADSLTEVQIGGVSYQVGPGRAIAATTDRAGKLVLSIAARGLNPPVVYLNADGLESGLAIDFAAPVNDFLAGQGTLPSQAGPFTADLLEKAQTVSNLPGLAAAALADWDDLKRRGLTPAVVVDHCANMYAQAAGGSGLRPAVIDGFAEPQPIVGYVIQRWDPDRPAYQPFRSYQELAAYRHYRNAHPAYGGWWEDFTNWASDVWEGIKTGAAKVAEVIVTTVTEIAVWIGEAVVSLGEFVIDAVEQAVQAVEAVFQMVADAVTRVVDWLKSLFAFRDIWETKMALEAGAQMILNWVEPVLARFGDQARGWFEKIGKEDIAEFFNRLRAQLGDVRAGDLQNRTPALTDASGGAVDKEALRHNPQATWMLNQAGGQLTAHPGSFQLALPDSPIPAAFEEFLDAVQRSGMQDLLVPVKDEMLKVFDPADPNGVAALGLVALLDLLETVAVAFVRLVGDLVDAVLKLLRVLSTAVITELRKPQDLGLINTLYNWVKTSAGEPEPDGPVSLLDLMSLTAAFFLTTIYKLIRGVHETPFPGGTFPEIPAPPWHPAYRPDAGGLDSSRAIIGVQLTSNILGLFAALTDIPLDYIVVKDDILVNDVWLPWATGVNLFCNMFSMVVANCPPIVGVEWDADRGLWSVIWAVQTSYTLLQGATLICYILARFDKFPKWFNTPVLKNLGDGLVGPILALAFNLPLVGLASAAVAIGDVPPYTAGATVMQFIPGVLPIFRIKTQPAATDPRFKARAYGVMGANLLVSVAQSAMGVVATCCELADDPPQINPPGPLTATAGTPFSWTLTADLKPGRPWNAPIKGWAFQGGGVLPYGLDLDETTGIISWTPPTDTRGTSFNFMVTCTDSYLPPASAAPCEITIKVSP